MEKVKDVNQESLLKVRKGSENPDSVGAEGFVYLTCRIRQL